MALPTQYLTSTKNLKTILNAIKTAKSPDRFNKKFLDSLEFKSSADRLMIGVLKSLGLLDANGVPTPRYHQFLDETQSGRVLAEGIEQAYADVFKIRKDAYNLDKGEVRNKFRTLTEGKVGESALDKMALTFTALCGLADWTGAPRESAPDPAPQEAPERTAAAEKAPVLRGIPGLHYNIEIHLPESRDPAVYDALFRSIREHLFR